MRNSAIKTPRKLFCINISGIHRIKQIYKSRKSMTEILKVRRMNKWRKGLQVGR